GERRHDACRAHGRARLVRSVGVERLRTLALERHDRPRDAPPERMVFRGQYPRFVVRAHDRDFDLPRCACDGALGCDFFVASALWFSVLPLAASVRRAATSAGGLGGGSGIFLPASTRSSSRGSSMTKRPGWRMRPATLPASSPAPQSKSARAGPTMAEPVSCPTISRRNFVFGRALSIGRSAWIKKGVP